MVSVATGFEALLAGLDAALSRPANHPDERYCTVRRMFFQHEDCGNSRRLVERVHQAVAARGGR